MNIISTDLYPMQVNPLNFSRGDVVKKVITDNIKTPYVGVVTSVIPSTNKVEVQWPSGIGLEDPWELIKINPFFEPPVVNQDKAYPTYYNERGKQKAESLKHYKVLEDFLHENVNPVILKASALYNEGVSKADAFKFLTAEFDNKAIVEETLSKIFNDSFEVKRSSDLFVGGEYKTANLNLSGNSDFGFKLSYSLGNETSEQDYDNAKIAIENFNRVEEILTALTKKPDYAAVVGSVAQRVKELKQQQG